jgi:hypothetical protein
MERREKELLDGVVSSMGKCEELLNSGVLAMEENGGKFAGQWCFNNGENGKRLLNSGVSAMEKWCEVIDSGVSAMGKVKNLLTVVFQQWKKSKELMISGVSAMGKLSSS